ncbi:sulfatase-like hydrolase/transferase [Demequina soli]|uniref:sulfatase-like hydrolase/transferase n=1 Tax=Demequina soli TaxID=1638987 RepID=UPI0007826AE7|nr:sulfatase-like hydrolase/transferase [Demequina soli]
MSSELPPESPETAPAGAAETAPADAPEATTVDAPHRQGRGKRILKATGLTLAIPGAAVVAGAGYVGFEALTNSPDDSPEHEAAKDEYLASLAGTTSTGKAPNVLLVYYDDLGYGDLGFTGQTPIKTPNIDRLAEEGVVLTNYHSPAAVCTPSRAAMLTGRLSPRADVTDILFPTGTPMGMINKVTGTFGLTQAEITIPDVLKAAGYSTEMIGKWHVGDTEGALPNDFGFDTFLGSRYSNDIEPFKIYRDDEVLVDEVDQTEIDGLYTDEAVRFIGESAQSEDPFFLYFAHNFPHEPLYTAAENEGRSDAGLYGDVVETLDDGIGRIVDELEATGQLDNTIIMITSDNGPWHLGDAGDQRGRKGSVNEGGMQVPFLIHWPDGVEGGRTLDTMAMGTDILPTLMDWLDIAAPTDRVLDGTSMAPLLAGQSEKVGDFYYYYASDKLIAVSDGRYKYYRQHPYLYGTSDMSFTAATQQGPWLFDLTTDPAESYDLLERHPDVAETLKAELERRDAEMAENPRGWIG